MRLGIVLAGIVLTMVSLGYTTHLSSRENWICYTDSIHREQSVLDYTLLAAKKRSKKDKVITEEYVYSSSSASSVIPKQVEYEEPESKPIVVKPVSSEIASSVSSVEIVSSAVSSSSVSSKPMVVTNISPKPESDKVTNKYTETVKKQPVNRYPKASVNWKTVYMNTSPLHIRTFSYRKSFINDKIMFINMHDNEDTAVEAAEAYIYNNGGVMIDLRHSKTDTYGTRAFYFNYAGKNYGFDPNRIFTDKGIRNTLSRYGGRNSGKVFGIVNNVSSQITRNFYGKTVVVALHNNLKDVYFGIKLYKRNGVYGSAVSKLHESNHYPSTDFYLVTEPFFYDSLKDMGHNVVLLSRKGGDNGALSVYCQKYNIPYINIECLEGNYNNQMKMIQDARRVIYQFIPQTITRKTMKM